MSLESIIDSILKDAEANAGKIIKEAKSSADRILQDTLTETKDIYNQNVTKGNLFCESNKEKVIVKARLEAKKNLLAAKQELINKVIEKLKADLKKSSLKKKEIFKDKTSEVPENIDFYLKNLRLDYESEIAKILFG